MESLIHSLTHSFPHSFMSWVFTVSGPARYKEVKLSSRPRPLGAHPVLGRSAEEDMVGNEDFTEVLTIASGPDGQLSIARQREGKHGEETGCWGARGMPAWRMAGARGGWKILLSLVGLAELCGRSGQRATEWGVMGIKPWVGSSLRSKCGGWSLLGRPAGG